MADSTQDRSDFVTREVRDGIAIISLNRPEVHNAFNDPMRQQLREAVAWADKAPEVRVVVIRGNGRSFCSGRDNKSFGERAPGVTHMSSIENAQAVRMEQLRIKKPTIAAVQGAAMGAGAELAMVMDFRVVADTLKFSLPEVNYGLTVDTGASTMAVAYAGLSRAKWLIMTGEAIGAEQALAWGLADWAVPAAQLDEKAMSIARTLAAKPPAAVAMTKRVMTDALEERLVPGMKRELLAQCVLFDGQEFKDLRDARKAGKK